MIRLVDPADRVSDLQRDGDTLVCGSRRYPIRDGIPRFVDIRDDGQRQTAQSFGYKWTRQPDWAARDGERNQVLWDLWRELYGFDGPGVLRTLTEGKVVLDAGCGSGTVLKQIAKWPAAIAAADISQAIDSCRAQLAERPDIVYAQADLHMLPFPEEYFDVVWSSGVLHHTPDTRRALRAVTRHVAKGGRIAFYVYVRKGPIREYVDDLLRAEISDLPPAEAWQRMEALTKVARSLAALPGELTIEDDVPELGFKAGRYHPQRFVYYNLFKCFWNDGLSFEENVNVNFDWYHPKYAHRHTAVELREWLAELQLHPEYFHVGESGITVIAIKQR